MSWRVAAVLAFGGVATLSAIAILASSLDSAYALAALLLTLDVIALLSAVLARDEAPAIGFSPLDLVVRFLPSSRDEA